LQEHLSAAWREVWLLLNDNEAAQREVLVGRETADREALKATLALTQAAATQDLLAGQCAQLAADALLAHWGPLPTDAATQLPHHDTEPPQPMNHHPPHPRCDDEDPRRPAPPRASPSPAPSAILHDADVSGFSNTPPTGAVTAALRELRDRLAAAERAARGCLQEHPIVRDHDHDSWAVGGDLGQQLGAALSQVAELEAALGLGPAPSSAHTDVVTLDFQVQPPNSLPLHEMDPAWETSTIVDPIPLSGSPLQQQQLDPSSPSASANTSCEAISDLSRPLDAFPSEDPLQRCPTEVEGPSLSTA
jgi:hypothetical protein